MARSLPEKLRILPGTRAVAIHPPEGFSLEPGEVSDDVIIATTDEAALAAEAADAPWDVVLAFYTERSRIEREAGSLGEAAGAEGILWVAYPKGRSGVDTDLSRDRLLGVLGGLGWKGVALVSVDEVWSAMRFKPVEPE